MGPSRGPGSTDDPEASAGRPPGSRVRVRDPPSPLALMPAPPRAGGAVTRNFEIVGGVRAADPLIRNAGVGSHAPPLVRAEPQRCRPHQLPFPLGVNTALLFSLTR